MTKTISVPKMFEKIHNNGQRTKW